MNYHQQLDKSQIKNILFKTMKFSAVLLATVAVADDEEVRAQTPVEQLNSLVQFSEEILTDSFGFMKRQQHWVQKFQKQTFRMERAFNRCGRLTRKRREVDEELYNREDPSEGIKQITNGFALWAQRYIAECAMQRNGYNTVINRMDKWNGQLQAQLAKQ